MKQLSLILLVLLILSFNAMGQTLKSDSLSGTFAIPKAYWLRSSSTEYDYKPIQSKFTETLIALHLSPIVPIDSAYSDVDIFKLLLPSMTKKDFDYMKKRFVFNKEAYPNMKIVDIRFTVSGRTTDYTFEEFKKYLWP